LTKHQICLATSQDFYAGLSFAFRDPELSIIEIDLSGIRFLFPWQLTLAACLKVWCGGKAQLQFHWNHAKDFQNKVVSYAEQMGLFTGIGEGESQERVLALPNCSYNPDNYFELHRVEVGSDAMLAEQLTRLLAPYPRLAATLPRHLTDLSQNIFLHSGPKENTGWGFVQAQTTGGKLRIAFCDFGVGCYKTFQRNNLLQGRSPKEILETCLEPYGSCLAKDALHPNHGVGLSRICDFLNDHKGGMDIYSDGLLCRYSKGKKSTRVLGSRTKGTLISLEIRLL